jgi:hypothetical protein
MGHARDLLDKLTSLVTGKLEEFGRMTLQHEHGPTREKLVLVEICHRESAIHNPVILTRPLSAARVTG